MGRKKHTVEALTSVCSILAFAGSLMFLATFAEAKSWARRAANPPGLAQSADSRKAEVGGQQAGSQSKPNPAAVSRPSALTGSDEVGGKHEGSNSNPNQVSVSRRGVLTDIEVSFKLDPRLTKSVYMYLGENWISPPISLHADAQARPIPTVEAKVQVHDAKGQPVDLNPEWIPADPEMVTVSPSQGNAVQITVRHAGQSSLEVTSQRVSRKLAIMAWYQGDALQVQISETP